jgi:hypothetical protein
LWHLLWLMLSSDSVLMMIQLVLQCTFMLVC